MTDKELRRLKREEHALMTLTKTEQFIVSLIGFGNRKGIK